MRILGEMIVMRLLPAIDIRAGRCVRLLRGREDSETVYGIDPVAVADSWVAQGAEWLHIVNLDGAFGRASDNLTFVKKIATAGKAKIEFGGGLRSEEDVEHAFDIGVDKVVLGTIAVTDHPALIRILGKYGPSRVVVALDARNGIVTTNGWTSTSGVSVIDAALEFQKAGIREVLYTDIGKDGTLGGPDIPRLQELFRRTSLDVIASGGIGSLEDVRLLAGLKEKHLSGAIVGKALYEKKFTYREAVEAVRAGYTRG